MQGGKYDGDLGQIRDLLANERAVLALVPRMKAYTAFTGDEDVPPKLVPIHQPAPLPQLKAWFPKESVEELQDGTYRFRKRRFFRGMILKRVSTTRLQPMSPSLEEVAHFHCIGLGDLEDVEYYTREGDIVYISSSRITSTVGVVEKRDDLMVVVGNLRRVHIPPGSSFDLPSRAEALDLIYSPPPNGAEPDSIRVHLKEVRRLIDLGHEVRVRIGEHSQKRGLVSDLYKRRLWIKFDNDPNEPPVCVIPHLASISTN